MSGRGDDTWQDQCKRPVSGELQLFDGIIICDGVLPTAKMDCLMLYDRLIVWRNEGPDLIL